MGQLQSPIENVAKQRTQMPKELTKKKPCIIQNTQETKEALTKMS